ncbi:MAG: hypothetical protein V9G04_17520 [Nocardioides sp.]
MAGRRLMLPQILSRDLGFRWATPSGEPAPLVTLLDLPGAEPDRWLPTHLEALDDLLIAVASSYGEVLGGARPATRDEREGLTSAYREIDRASHEYAVAHAVAALPDDVRAGQIIGTGALMSIRARFALGLTGPAPFEGELDSPPEGAVGGTCDLTWASTDADWRGARWIVTTTTGQRLPATLGMLLFDSSGVHKDAALDEHRDALTRVTRALGGVGDRGAEPAALAPGIEPMAASGALDWLLFDWIMAHRESPDSGAVEIRSGRIADVRMLVLAAATSASVRSRFDLGLLD